MHTKTTEKPAKATTDLSSKVAQEPQSAHATPVVEKYVEKRKDKAEEQSQKEQENAPQTKTVWDEWVSYRYAIL
ncbi:hypothetical protein [Pedobacter sp. ASV12]|uniref:hypothetical protein n=1 Tax=Pedobacter sp. ASV12 TaxID=2795120 RepID=UPI0018ED9740|nr:hypothetical protein [Pedobacter sp. ASV12]